MTMTKTEAKNLLKRDFIPGGKNVSSDELKQLEFRRTTENEVFQCCVQTGRDVQSGPGYCGDIAEFVAFFDDGRMVAMCGKRGHTPPYKC